MDEKILLMIDAYADGELIREDEISLFEQLSVNAEARTYFRNINFIREELNSSSEEFPVHIEDKIVTRIHTPVGRISFGHSKFAAAATLFVLIIFSIITYSLLQEVSGYRKEISQVIDQINEQSKTIETLYNSLPPAIVHPVYSNEVIIKPNI